MTSLIGLREKETSSKFITFFHLFVAEILNGEGGFRKLNFDRPGAFLGYKKGCKLDDDCISEADAEAFG